MTPEERENNRINETDKHLEQKAEDAHFREAERQALSDHHFGCLARTALGLRRNNG